MVVIVPEGVAVRVEAKAGLGTVHYRETRGTRRTAQNSPLQSLDIG